MLQTWKVVENGKWYLQSSLSARIADLLYSLAAKLHFTLICYGFTGGKLDEGVFEEHVDVGWTVIEVTYCRAKLLLACGAITECSSRTPRIPLTPLEVKKAIKTRYAIDEAKAVKMLQGQNSAAAEVIIHLGLTRDIIRQAPAKIENNRAQQVVLCSILCATRFKYYKAGGLLKTTCLKCGSEDGYTHLVRCAGTVEPTLSLDPESIIDFLVELSKRALQINPGLPKPRRSEHTPVEHPEVQEGLAPGGCAPEPW